MAMSTPATEKLYLMLGMRALIDVKSDLKSLFTGYARDIVAQLGNTIRHLSMQFSIRIREGERRRQRREGGFVGAPCSSPSPAPVTRTQMLPRRLRPLAAPSYSPAGHQPRPAAARTRRRTQLLRRPARGEGRREQEKWRGEGKMRMTHGAHVGPTPSQLPRQIKPESKPSEDQK
uniref:Uncharacterized protein n=1 Tax=Oryza rufipogon TaxID=4529 RepID=A0A0E0RBA6_ORYRU